MRKWFLGGLGALVVVLLAIFRPDRALHVSSGLTAQMLCSAAFVSNLDPEQTFAETVQPMASVAAPFLRYDVDLNAKSVRASVAGIFPSTSLFHDGYGCRLEYADSVSFPPPLTRPSPAAELATYETTDPILRAALVRALAEDGGQAPRNVKAIVIVKDGHIVAEGYAPGYGPETPLLSYSVAKSVVSALIGILVRQGKLDVSAAAPVDAWHQAGDPRSVVTLDNLIRMASGTALTEDGSGFDAASQMVYTQNDMAAFAVNGPQIAKPGTAFAYTSTNTLVLSSIIRRSVGGGPSDYLRFAHDELFAPAGMRRVTMEFDGAGTQEGSASILAPARDWARFGLLYLNNGVAANGKRILSEDWIAYSKRSTLGSAYGAGFWTNDGPSEFAATRIKAGMPADAFFASGNLGQRIYIIPSEHLVMVRFGVTHRPPSFDIEGDLRLMRVAIGALHRDGAIARKGPAL